MSVTLIQDSSLFGVGGGVWTNTPAGASWYNSSALYASKASSTANGTLHSSFWGTALSFVGVSPSPNESQTFHVSIDGTISYDGTYEEAGVGGYLFTSPQLAGKWWTSNDYKVSTGSWDIRPSGNGSHTSMTVGDSFVFSFAGTSIAVAGIISWGSNGSISATFTLDDHQSSQTFNANSAPNSGTSNGTNFMYYQNATLSAGNHTLGVNVTAVSGELPFIIDYLTYKPSFSSISQKPNLTGWSFLSSGAASGSDTSGSGSSGSGSGSGSSGSGPSSGGGSADSSTSSKSSVPPGAIAGGIVGGLAFLALISGALFLYVNHKRSRLERPARSGRATDVLASHSNYPAMVQTEEAQNLNALYPTEHSGRPPLVSAPPTVFSEKSGNIMSWSGTDEYASSSGYSTPVVPRQLTVNDRQAEIRRRMEEIAGLMQQVDPQTVASSATTELPTSDARTSELQARIDLLTRENERLMSGYVAPPAYEGDDGTQRSSDLASRSDTGMSSSAHGRSTAAAHAKDEKIALRPNNE